MNKKTRRAFTKEYNAEIVDVVRQADGNAAKVAREVSLTPQTVSAWVRQTLVDDGKGQRVGLTTAELTELSKLRKGNSDLRMEREFLKKFRRGSRGRANEICGYRPALSNLCASMDVCQTRCFAPKV